MVLIGFLVFLVVLIIYIKDLSGNTSEANIKINNVEDEKIAIISN